MKRFIFWQRWLVYTSLFMAVMAVAYAVFPDARLFAPYNRAISQALYQRDALPAEALPFRNFIYGPLGGTMACLYMLLAFIAQYAFKRKERWARNAILFSFGAWTVIDSVICLYHGAHLQVWLVNALSLLQKALPLIFTWKEFETTVGMPVRR